MSNEELKLKLSVIISATNTSGNQKLDAIMELFNQLHPSPTPDVTQVEDGKQGGEVKTKEEIFKSKYLEEYFKLHNKDDEAANQSLVVTYKMNSILKRAILSAMDDYKSQPSTPVQPGERINKVKDAIGFLLSCAYPEMIASEYNRNKEVLTEICKLIDTITTSTPAQDGWVRVEDGLPELYTTCMVTDAGTVDMAIYLPENRWEDKCNEGLNHVTHWQPLPSPPVNKQD